MTLRPTCLVPSCPNPASGFQHHPTGTDSDGKYFDPWFRVGLCHDHHYLVHDDWHTHQVADGETRTTFLEWLQVTMARLATSAGRIAGPEPRDPLHQFLADIAAWLARSAVRLGIVILALDTTCPTWRQSPDV